MTVRVPFLCNFRRVSNKFPSMNDFLTFNFSNFTPQVKLFFVGKGNIKFSDSKV